jgi:catechol 2,3-dioxygenase-like lactoylglutathione lyase family enzyme
VEVLSSRVLLRAADLDAAVAWFRDVLGLRIAREFGADGRVTGVVFFLGGGLLEISQAGSSATSANGGALTLWLQVPDLPLEHERLAAAGVMIDRPPERMPWGLDELWVRGPDDVRLVLVEVPADHPLRRRL